MTRSLARRLLLLLSLMVAAPLRAQDASQRLPDAAAFSSLIQSLKQGMDDGFAELRGERTSRTSWKLRLPEGLLDEEAAASPGYVLTTDGSFNFTTGSLESGDAWTFLLELRRIHAPTDEQVAAFQADFARLSGAMVAAAGDWSFRSVTEEKFHTRWSVLTPPGPEGGGIHPRIRLSLFEGRKEGRAGDWSLVLQPTARADELPYWAPGDPATYSGIPTDEGFRAALEDMQAGMYDGFEPLKGLVSPEFIAEESSGCPTWSVKPVEGLPIDRMGVADRMTDWGNRVYATYRFTTLCDPTEEERDELVGAFARFADIMAAHVDGWQMERVDHADSADALVSLMPGPGMKFETFDWETAPSLELELRTWTSTRADDGGGERPVACLALELRGIALGRPARGHGTADWVLALLEDDVELPPIPANLEEVVLSLVADAPASFESFARGDEVDGIDWQRHELSIHDATQAWTLARRALNVGFIDAPDPDVLRDSLIRVEDSHTDYAGVRLALLSLPGADWTTRRLADDRMDAVCERLAAALGGWRVSGPFTSSAAKVGEDFQYRTTYFEGLRADGHPLWIDVERTIYPRDVPGQPAGDLYQLAVYIGTDHGATVGEDVPARWAEALHQGAEPLTSLARVLGDPLEGVVEPGDLFVTDSGLPNGLVGLFGTNGEAELRFDVVRGGRFEEVVLTPPRLSIARWEELRAEAEAGELSLAALATCGARLDGAEVAAGVRALVAAGESDFAALPAALHGRVEVNVEHGLATARWDLWKAESSATAYVIDNLRRCLNTALGSGWYLDPAKRNGGPLFDRYARQIHWSARPKGPNGAKPWVELVDDWEGDQARIAIEVHGFTAAHRASCADHPERLWFFPLSGDCTNGRGVAWCHREGVSFDGPFGDGLPHGTGRHLYAGGKAMVGVVYEHGDLRRIGEEEPPPAPPVATVSEVRADYRSRFSDFEDVNWEDDWSDSGGKSGWTNEHAADLEYIYLPGGTGHSDICGACGGSGWIDSSSIVEAYDVQSTATSIALWVRGYDAIVTYKGTRRVHSSSVCSRCSGTGTERW
ncbi:MAG: hypothetical protein H6828_11585 [Planctomycetes bacterium]|nr:hypothetical protein [Planctomycetota bacterium]